jgi:hypothetical protein
LAEEIHESLGASACAVFDADLRDQVRRSPHVAARSIQIV